jgi:hypothetical protein
LGRRQVRELGWEEEGRGEGRGERGMNGRRGDKEGKVDIGRSVCNAGKTIKGKCSGEGRGLKECEGWEKETSERIEKEKVRGGGRGRNGRERGREGRERALRKGRVGMGVGGGRRGGGQSRPYVTYFPYPPPPKHQTFTSLNIVSSVKKRMSIGGEKGGGRM